MASGAASSTAQILCPARLVRSTSHAPPTPITTHSGTVISTSLSVFRSNSPTRGRNTMATAVSQPALTVATATNPSGSSEKAAIRAHRTTTGQGPRRVPRPLAVRGDFLAPDATAAVVLGEEVIETRVDPRP